MQNLDLDTIAALERGLTEIATLGALLDHRNDTEEVIVPSGQGETNEAGDMIFRKATELSRLLDKATMPEAKA
jgi:hypothetical protein